MGTAMVIGSGGREHALAWSLSKNPSLSRVYCSSGNAGTALEQKAENVSLPSFKETHSFIKRNNVGLIVIGPEKPLAEGLADLLRENNVRVFGFGKGQARLESSKAFSREFCNRHGVSCPSSEVFTDSSTAISYLEENRDGNFFIKADELCGGKGAIPARNTEEGAAGVKELMTEKKCGAGEKILVEEWLEGQELTIMAFTDGRSISVMPASQDHKRLLDGDRGPNTGGMGAYAPAPLFDKEVEGNFRRQVLKPTLKGLKKEGFKDAGILYFGLIVDSEKNTRLLEYNVRFGDPEAQPVLMLLESDLFEILSACADGTLGDVEHNIKWSANSALCITLAAKGYPSEYGKEREAITGIKEAESAQGVKVFHAGTLQENGKIVTAGGRILSVTASGVSLRDARDRAYSAAAKINFNGLHYRKDIGRKAGV